MGRPKRQIIRVINRSFWLLGIGLLVSDYPTPSPNPGNYQGTVWNAQLYPSPEPTRTEPAPLGDLAHARTSSYYRKFQNPTTQEIPEHARAREVAFIRNLQAQQNGDFTRFRTEAWPLISRGPNNLGGRTRALALDMRNDSILLAGGVSGGMWRSKDRGRTWTLTTRPDQISSVSCVLQDRRPGFENVWYYGTGELFGNTASAPRAPYRGDGVFRSVDNGASWQQIPNTATGLAESPDAPTGFNHINSLAQDISNLTQPEIYAAVPYGIYRSTDSFFSYEQVLGGQDLQGGGQWTEVMTTPQGTVYATISNENNSSDKTSGIFYSEDGLEWINITPTEGYENGSRRIIMACVPGNEQTVYFLGDTNTGPRLHRYSASTNTWTDLSVNLPAFGGRVGNLDLQNSYNMVLEVHPLHPETVIVGGTNLYLSRNGFQTNTQTLWIGGYNTTNDFTQYRNHHADQHALVFTEDGFAISAHDGGLSYSLNLRTAVVMWVSLNRGYNTTQAYSVGQNLVDTQDPIRITGMQDNGTYQIPEADPKGNWEEINSGDGGFCAITPTSIITSRQFGQLHRYPIDPLTGQSLPSDRSLGLPNGGAPSQFDYTTPWQVDPARPNRIFVAGRRGLWFQKDITHPTPREQWKLMSSDLVSGSITALGIGEAQPHLWIGTDIGRLYRVANHLQDQLVPQARQSPLFPKGGYISSIAVHPQRPDEVWVTFSNYGIKSVFRTVNGGLDWTAVGGNLDEATDENSIGPAISWVAMLPQKTTTHYFLGTSAGLFHTEEVAGENTKWQQVGMDELGMVPIDQVVVNTVEGTVLIATHGRGVYELQASMEWQPRAVIIGDEALCGSEPSTTLLASRIAHNQSVTVQYQWFREGDTLSEEHSPFLTTSNPGTYVAAIRRSDDPVVRYTNAILLQDRVPDTINLTTRNDSLIVENDCSGCQYLWIRDGVEQIAITSQPSLFIGDILARGSFTVQVSNGCDPVVSNAVKLEGADFTAGELVIYPNPASQRISLAVIDQAEPVLGVRLLTLSGQVLEDRQQGDWRNWDISDLRPGNYLFEVYGITYRASALLRKE